MVELPVDLVGGREHEGRFRVVLAGRLEEVQRAASVDLEVGFGVDQGGGDRHLGGEVQDRVLALDVFGQDAGVSDVLFDEGGARRMLGDQPPEVPFGAAAAQVVEDGHVPASLDEVHRRVDSEESRAAGDEDSAWGRTRFHRDTYVRSSAAGIHP